MLLPGTDANISNGGIKTEFGLSVPPDAHCPGDSVHGYFVWGYLIPAGMAAADLTWSELLPQRGYDLFYNDSGDPWGPVNTDLHSGAIRELPNNFSWARFDSDRLISAGRTTAQWTMGIACTAPGNKVTNYWDTTIVFHRNPANAAGFTWQIPYDAPAPGSGLPWDRIAPFAIAVVAGGLSVWLYRSRRRPDRIVHPTEDTEVVQHV